VVGTLLAKRRDGEAVRHEHRGRARLARRSRRLARGLASFGHVADAARVDVTHGVILYLEDVTVSFDGFRALNALSLAIDDGELRCVIGPNGAGKTTMMDVITGKTRPTAGRVFYGQSIDLTADE